jgi:glycine cleavage system H protein
MAQELLFSKTHEWVQWLNDEKTEAYIGLSQYAVGSLGDIVYVSIDEADVSKGDTLGDIESVKAVSDLYSPVTGTVTEVNSELIDNPALINIKAETTWICKISNIVETEALLSKEDYDKLDKE